MSRHLVKGQENHCLPDQDAKSFYGCIYSQDRQQPATSRCQPSASTAIIGRGRVRTFSSAAAYSKPYPYLSCDAKGKSSEEMRMKRILDEMTDLSQSR